MAKVAVEIVPEELGYAIDIGDIQITECQMINQFKGSAEETGEIHPRLRADLRTLRAQGHVHGPGRSGPARPRIRRTGQSAARDEEFVLYHTDNVEASGFVQHLKLPHYVDFQGELGTVRHLRAEALRRKQREDDS